MDYNLVLTHDVAKAEYLGEDTIKYTIENNKAYTIKFGEREGGIVTRHVCDDQGRHFYEEDGFEECREEGDALTKEDYAQWTADNFCEIEDTFSYMEENGLTNLVLAEG